MPGGLDSDTQAVRGGVADCGDHVVDGSCRNDDLGLVLDGEVVAEALGVVGVIVLGEVIGHDTILSALSCANNLTSSID